ncbi:WD40 repeat protein [Deinococcus sp. HSC-46F16]|uniref:WD40 repeat domain-containing protein n=1 Tax=Deinococcus sp. HSC-46F16 TaxID=2910968 RepID=UPI00209F1474|nr:WD40 repeat domain-containing protein [Deinococcus sp. HSC-46F16]MCP2014537.1 WD40 repeat protein [Deinococcus sp. HSC-46F16]
MHRTSRWLWALLLTATPLAAAQVVSLKLVDTWTFGGHVGEVTWGTLTPDGKQVYTQSGPQLLTWDAASGRLLSSREPAPGERLSVPAGDWPSVAAPESLRTLVQVGEGDKARLKVLELASGTFSGDFGPLPVVFREQWTPGQRAVAFVSHQAPYVYFWQEGQAHALTLSGETARHGGDLQATFAPDTRTLYVLGQQLTAYDMTADPPRPLWSLTGPEVAGRDGESLSGWVAPFASPVLSHNPARPQVLLSSAQGLMLLNTQGDPAPLWLDPRFGEVPGILTVAWSRDGDRAFLGAAGYLHEIDTATGRTLGIVDGRRLLAQTPQRLWTAHFDRVAEFDRVTGLDDGVVSEAPAWNAPLAVDETGAPVAALVKAGPGLAVRHWAAGQETVTPLSDHFTRAAASSPDGGRVASVGSANVQMLDRASRRLLWQVAARDAHALAFSPDGRLLALGEGGQTRLLDVATGAVRATFKTSSETWKVGARGLNRALAFSPEGRRLLVGYEAGGAAVWNVATGEPEWSARAVPSGKGWVLSAAFSPEGKRVALGTGGGAVHIFSLPDTQVAATYTLPGAVRALAFGPDGSLAAGSLTGEVRRWDAGRGGAEMLGQKLASGVTALAFSSGGTLVAGTAGGDLLALEPGQPPQPLARAGGLVQSLSWNAARAELLSSERDNAVRFYRAEGSEK